MRAACFALAAVFAGCGHAVAPADMRDASAAVDMRALDLGAVDALPPVEVSVTVDHGVALASLDSTFIGLSYEKGTLPTKLFDAGNKPLIALFQRIGPSILRVGGNSVDETTWNGSGAGGVSKQIAPADVDRLAAFAKATGWKVIYGVNMGASSTPTTATGDEAAYAANALGASLYGFEIGNEPDLYKSKYRPANYSYATFQNEWQAYATAIGARVPGAVFTGDAAANNAATWTIPFAAAEKSAIALLTQHYYIANGMLATSTIDKMLAPNPALASEVTKLATAAQSAGIAGGARLAECNSFYNGGSSGVSDSFASALWVVDFAFSVASAGGSGINLHGGGNGSGYTPIANDATGAVVAARPEYYGVALFAMAANGTLRPVTMAPSGLAASAYAVDERDGSMAIVIIDKDASQPLRVTIDLAAAATTATLLTLTGPSLASTTGQLLGGAPIAADGSWNPAPLPKLPIGGMHVTVDVPPASAVLVRAR